MTYHAQFGEDRILEQCFAQIGTHNRVAVDLGASDGIEFSNTAYFRKHQCWRVVLIDVAPRAAHVMRAHVSSRNVNAVLDGYQVPQDFDLLSIDVDGNDYWIWQALTYQPRVVVIEFNPGFGLDDSITVENDPGRLWDHTDYFGASVTALYRLGQAKGYDLVASTPVNLIFAPAGLLPAISPSEVRRSGHRKAPDPQHRAWVVVA